MPGSVDDVDLSAGEGDALVVGHMPIGLIRVTHPPKGFFAWMQQYRRVQVRSKLWRHGDVIVVTVGTQDGDDVALADGDLVCIFPEGRITDTGELYPFRPGIARIVEHTPVPVVPMALRGLWGSFFSRVSGRAMSNPLHLRPFSKVGLVASAAFDPHSATPQALQAAVVALRGDAR